MKINRKCRVAVTSRSFSRHPILRKELLKRYENVTFNDEGLSLKHQALFEFLRGHDKAIVALEKIDEELLSRLPELKVVSKYGVGLDGIDQNAIRKYNKHLSWFGGVNRRSVAELTLAFMIMMLRHVPKASQEVCHGIWQQHVGSMLSNRTVGIIGCGYIGKDLVLLLKPFDCKILVYDIREYVDFYREHNVESVSLEDLLTRSDVVTLHVPLDDSTSGMLDKNRLNLMQNHAVLINVARGGLVDEQHLKCMLKEKRLAGAAFDVFHEEPPQDTELLKLSNFLATPHIGGSAEEAILAMGRAAIQGLDPKSSNDQ